MAGGTAPIRAFLYPQSCAPGMPCCKGSHAKRGATIGASVGAALGSPLGPVGAGVGAGFGGATGYLAGYARDQIPP
jgi:hypothetical protein